MRRQPRSWHRQLSRRRLLQGMTAAGVLAAACSSPTESKPAAQGGTPVSASTSAASAGSAPVNPTHGGRIVRFAPGDPPNFDPHATISYLTVGFLDGFHTKLVRYDYRSVPPYQAGNEQVMGELAEKWETPDDNRTWIFHLRQGVKFHDKPPVNGREVTADDVKWSWERALAPGQVIDRWAWNMYDNIEVVDPHTIKFTLKFPVGRLPFDLENYQSLVLPHEADEKIGLKLMDAAVIGAGPWILDSYQPGTQWVAKRNPAYAPFPGWPVADEFRSAIINVPASRTSAFRARQIDIHNPQPQEVASIKASNPDAKWKENVWLPYDTWMIAMDTQSKPFNDVRVRRAVSMAIDRQAWLKLPSVGNGKIESGPVTWAMGDWKLPPEKMGDAAQWLTYDPGKAKQLLAAAGYPDGFETTLNLTAFYGPSFQTEGELVQEFLGKVGIKASINTVEYSRWISETYLGKYTGMVWGPDSLDRLTAQMIRRYSSWSDTNRSKVNDPDLDRRLVEWRGISDPQKSKETAWDLQKYMVDQSWAIYRPEAYTAFCWQPYVKNYEGETEFAYETFYRSTFLWTDPVQKG